MSRGGRFELLVTVEASLSRRRSPAAADEEPEETDDEKDGEAPHADPCRQPGDFSGASSAAFAASSVPLRTLSCSRFASHSASASFISLHHLKWWL